MTEGLTTWTLSIIEQMYGRVVLAITDMQYFRLGCTQPAIMEEISDPIVKIGFRNLSILL